MIVRQSGKDIEKLRETERNRFINMEKHSERKREGERERERVANR